MDVQSRVFAALPLADFTGKEKQRGPEVKAVNGESSGSHVREVQVTGAAEVSCTADQASLRVSVTNTKESVNEVNSSVTRRLEYILQALRQHGVREEDTSVKRFLRRDADLFSLTAEVVISFTDFEKMEQICSILQEKLDKSVCVEPPQFYHSPECLNQMRQRACVSAVENAQQKANKICQVLGQRLGSPLLVREEETKEWSSKEEEDGGSAPCFPHRPSVTVSSRVSISFSIKNRNRKKL